MDMSLSKLQEIVKAREAWGAKVHGVMKNQTWLSQLNNLCLYDLSYPDLTALVLFIYNIVYMM